MIQARAPRTAGLAWRPWRAWGTLQWALCVSLAVHAGLLTVRFVDPEAFHRVFQETPLDVILVNAKSRDKPLKAQAVAQANLQGGGDGARERATSPLPPAPTSADGEALEHSKHKLDASQELQTMLLAQLRQQLASLPLSVPKEASNAAEQARTETHRQMTRSLAEIERRINEENARPRKRYISPSTREEVYAIYYDAMRRRIELRGTEHFPELGGSKLYGELTMTITVNHDGRVLETDVVEGSGNRALDRQAKLIARSAGPFDAFTSAMRQKADQLVLVARFKFSREEKLEAKFGAQ